MLYWPPKHPEEVTDYGADWSSTAAKLGAVSIVDSQWTRQRGDVLYGSASVSGMKTSIRLRAGSVSEHVLRNVVTFNTGDVRRKDCFISIR